MTFVTSFLSYLPNSFPSWLLHSSHSSENEYTGGRHSKPCRACTDFKSWMKASKSKTSTGNTAAINNKDDNDNIDDTKWVLLFVLFSSLLNLFFIRRKDCPLDKDELGRNSWSLFHTMAAYYPETPNQNEQTSMQNFIKALSLFYPCDVCAQDFRKDIEENPPKTGSRRDLSLWWCDAHNRVNKKLGKPEFDCSKLDERWFDGC